MVHVYQEGHRHAGRHRAAARQDDRRERVQRGDLRRDDRRRRVAGNQSGKRAGRWRAALGVLGEPVVDLDAVVDEAFLKEVLMFDQALPQPLKLIPIEPAATAKNANLGATIISFEKVFECNHEQPPNAVHASKHEVSDERKISLLFGFIVLST